MPSDAAMRAAKAIYDQGLLEDHPIPHPLIEEAAEIIDREMGAKTPEFNSGDGTEEGTLYAERKKHIR